MNWKVLEHGGAAISLLPFLSFFTSFSYYHPVNAGLIAIHNSSAALKTPLSSSSLLFFFLFHFFLKPCKHWI